MKETLIQFLKEAKSSTYASNDQRNKRKYPDGASEYIYRMGTLVYSDRYYGGEPFLGEELVFEDDVAIWGMNYSGRIANEYDSEIERIYLFLQKSLCQEAGHLPLRGPQFFTLDNYIYRCTVDGDIDCFQGKETIIFRDTEQAIYSGYFHGGCINRIAG